MSVTKTYSGSKSCSMQRSRWTQSQWRSRTAAPQTSTSSLPRYSWRGPDPAPVLFRLVGCAEAGGLAALGVDGDAVALCDFAYSDNWRRGNAPCERDRNRVMRADRGRALFVFHRQCPRLVQWWGGRASAVEARGRRGNSAAFCCCEAVDCASICCPAVTKFLFLRWNRAANFMAFIFPTRSF